MDNNITTHITHKKKKKKKRETQQHSYDLHQTKKNWAQLCCSTTCGVCTQKVQVWVVFWIHNLLSYFALAST